MLKKLTHSFNTRNSMSYEEGNYELVYVKVWIPRTKNGSSKKLAYVREKPL